MTTIAQLPPVISVGPGDLTALSQAGVLYAASVGQLTVGLQPAISVPSGALLGRQSIGAGAPETISLGAGVVMQAGALAANGADHAGFPVLGAMSLTDELVANVSGQPGLLPVAALRGLFVAGDNVAIDDNGVISVTLSSVTGPAGVAGPQGPAGVAGPVGAMGPAGVGLTGPAAGNSASAVGASDYVALWQNGALAWMTYGQFLGGQTIDQLPAAGPAADSDELMVAQGGNTLSVQSFGALWSYVQGKLPSVLGGVVELSANTVLDATTHNNRILVASAPMTLSANFVNMGSGFFCRLVNLAPGPVTMGTGITSGSGSIILPPGAMTDLMGLSYSGGSLVWWSGVTPNAPTITIGSIIAPALNIPFTVSGGVFNDAPTALDYSIDGGVTWVAAASPVITQNAFSFTMPGLNPGVYAIRVRDHANVAVLGVSNNFTITAPSVSLGAVPGSLLVNQSVSLAGTVLPANAGVQVGLSTSQTVAPSAWVAANVAQGAWSATLTPMTVGDYYVWVSQSADVAVQAVSGVVSVVAASLSVSAVASGMAGSALAVSGTVTPAGDAVGVQLSTQNTSAPSGGWTPAVNNAGTFTVNITPQAAGTYYVWAQDAAAGTDAVSGAITVSAAAALTYGINNPGSSYVHGVSTIPLNGAINPPQGVNTQVALGVSATVPPSGGWVSASVIDGNAIWAAYVGTPATAGAYYVWVQTASGGSVAVSDFTVTVT
ncbi:MAG: collagen-like protein [Acidocella sp.]|nr:collagen-like protein [Acidocella sp.]